MANKTETATATPKTDEPKVKEAPKMPTLGSFKGDARTQMEAVLNSAKNFINLFKAATAVDVGSLRDVRRALYAVTTDELKGRKVDPKVRKRELLQKRIEKARKELEELGA